jgi:hypothetical protein
MARLLSEGGTVDEPAVDDRSEQRLTLTPRLPGDPYEQATLLIIHLGIVVVGFDVKLAYGVSAAVPLVVVALPLWVKHVRQYPLAPLILLLGMSSAVSGLVLSGLAAYDHDVLPGNRVQMTGLLLSGISGLILVLWARQLIPLHRVVALYGLGGVAAALADGRWTWKFGVAVPATFLVIGVLERSGSRARPTVAVIALGLVSVVDDYRSYFAFCLLAAMLGLWQLRPTGAERSGNRWWPALLLVGLGFALYVLTTALLTAGYLGEDVQLRSQAQIERSGSLLAGGRPEWAATLELVKLRPLGYGAGVVPNFADVQAAKSGLASINYGLNPERDRYMFGTEFRLHSILADLWVRFGLVGVAFAVAMLFGVVRGLSTSLAERTASTSAILASLLALWSFAFEPSTTYWVRTSVAVGFVLVVRQSLPAGVRTTDR